MRLLKFLAVLMVASCLFGVSSFAQGAHPAQQAQPVAQPPTQTPQQAPKSPDDRLLMKDAIKISPGSLQKALQEAKAREMLQSYRLLAGNRPQHDSGPGSFDDGIYLRQVDGANVCGAIVSYNFSSGENPELESVTTCTPTNSVITKRARGTNKVVKRPQVVRIGFQRDEKKCLNLWLSISDGLVQPSAVRMCGRLPTWLNH